MIVNELISKWLWRKVPESEVRIWSLKKCEYILKSTEKTSKEKADKIGKMEVRCFYANKQILIINVE